MKTRVIGSLGIMIIMVMVGVSTTAIAAESKTINLKFAGLLPAGTSYAAPADEWGKLVEQRTKGAVKLTTYHGQSLGKYTEFPKLMKSGLCDMAFVSGGTPGFELLGLAELPPFVTSIRIGMDMLHAIYRKGLFSSIFEENGFKLMFYMNSYPRLIWFRDKKVTKFSDFKGLKIRGTSPQHVEVAKALGATAVMISPADLYMALDRGTIDGLLIIAEGMFALKLTDLIKYCLWEPVATDVTAVVMSLKVWNSLPPEIRVVIQDINEEMRYRYIEYNKTDQEDQERTRKAGIEVNKFNSTEKAALRAALEPVAQAWIEKMEEKGVPAKKVSDEMMRILKQY